MVETRKSITRRPAEILTPVEVSALVGRCSKRYPTGIRNRALITVLYRSGLRIAEALSIFPKDLDREGCAIRVLHGKGDRARTIGMDPKAFETLELWLATKRDRGIGGPVFSTLKGGTLADSYVRELLPRLARKAGVEKRVHAHGFRHTMASELRAEHVDIGIISKQLGHQSIDTTARYLDHLQPTAAIDAMRARTW